MEYIYLHGSLGVTQDLEAEGNIQKDTREKRERSETKAFIVTPFQSASVFLTYQACQAKMFITCLAVEAFLLRYNPRLKQRKQRNVTWEARVSQVCSELTP